MTYQTTDNLVLTKEQYLAEQKKLDALIAKEQKAKERVARARTDQARASQAIEAIKKDRDIRNKEAKMQISLNFCQAIIKAAKEDYEINEFKLQKILTKYLPENLNPKEYKSLLNEEPEEAKTEDKPELEEAFAVSETEAF